jgi:predicted enzyme related to lactoylglutathione lyase
MSDWSGNEGVIDMSNPVIHWEIGASDMARLGAFYGELFGWTIAPAGPEYLLVEPSETGIGGGIMQIREGMPPYLTFYVEVPELEASLLRAIELGGSELVPPTEIPKVGRFAMFVDPDGHTVGLLEPTAV